MNEELGATVRRKPPLRAPAVSRGNSLGVNRPRRRVRGSSGSPLPENPAAFFQELLLLNRLPSTPDILAGILKRSGDLLASRLRGSGIAVWYRHQGKIELVCRSGLPPEWDDDGFRLKESVWEEAWRASKTAFGTAVLADVCVGASGRPLKLSRECWKWARVMRWGIPEKLDGLVLVCSKNIAGIDAELVAYYLQIVSAYFNSLAEMTENLWELDRTRARLEGEFSTLHMVVSTITAHPDRPGDMLSSIVSIVAKALEADLCAFLLYDEKSGELVTQPGAYGLSDDEDALYRMPLANAKSSSVQVFMTGVPFMTADAQNDPRVISRFAEKWKIHSLIVVPLTLENRRVGVMRVGSRKKDFFTKNHLRLVELIAEEAVVLVETAILTSKLSEANKQLSEINRIKDDFVSTVSHEFKTPLTAIKGFLSVMLDGDTGGITEQQRQFLKIAISSTDRLTALVADLLDLSKLEGGLRMDFAPVSVEELLERCVQDYRYQAEINSLELKAVLPARLAPVKGDVKWLRQVLDNLVSNALKFTPEDGKVTLSAVHQGEMVRVSVEDTGVGISPQDQKHVFEKFYRVNRTDVVSPPGTGLGLAIAKYIVDKHDGKIWLESEVGKGTKFHFIVPVAKPKEEVVYLHKESRNKQKKAIRR